MTDRREIIYISVAALVTDEANVRRDPASEAADAELLASIREDGLLHPLGVRVIEDSSDRSGIGRSRTYGVVAGARRCRALKAIQSEDGGDPFEVPCYIVDEADAKAISLTENVTRVPMHPADQVAAFAQLAEAGATADDIAARFGLAVDTVKRRLRLGSLPDHVIDDWRAGATNEATCHQLATTENAEEAGHIYDRLKKEHQGHVSPWAVSRELKERRVSASGPLARYVTIKAYRAAGGAVEETLFEVEASYGENPGKRRVTDVTLLKRLAHEKLERAAKKAGKGWKWTLALLDWDWQVDQEYETMRMPPAVFTDDEKTRLKELDSQDETLLAKLRELPAARKRDEAEKEAAAAIQAERAPIRDEDRKIRNEAHRRREYSDQQKALGGVIAHLDRQGKVAYKFGRVAPADLDEYRKVMGIKDTGSGGAKKPAGPYPKAIMQDLQLIRTASIGRKLAASPRLARDVLTFELAYRSGFNGQTYLDWERKLLNLRSDTPRIRPSKPLQADEATAGIGQPYRGSAKWDWLDTEATGKEAQAEAFERFMALGPKQRDVILAHLVADLLMPREGGKNPSLEAIVERLDMTPADFRASLEGGAWPARAFWLRLSKAAILKAGRKALGAKWANRVKNVKKAELAAVTAVEVRDNEKAADWNPEGI